jgi:ArsR family transcriptional regulator
MTLAPISPDARSDLEAKFFRGLGEPIRLRILHLLRREGELPLARLVAGLGEPASRVSTHLSCLRSCGYVVARREGRYLYHRLRDDRVTVLLDLAETFTYDRGEVLADCPTIDGGRILATLDFVPPVRGEDGAAGDSIGDHDQASRFGPWLRAQLARRELEPAAFASATGVSVAAARRWLYRGGHPAPSLRPRIAEVLDVPVEELRRVARGTAPSHASAFASWLDAQLEARDWTHATLADRLEVNRHAVTAWRQHGVTPRRATLERLAAVFDVPVEEIPVSP